jgi:hypothetical protein
MDRLASVLWIMSGALFSREKEPFFSGAVALSIAIDDFAKGYHVCGLPTESVHGVYVDWCEKLTCRVERVFPYRVYIDSNRRDSRI